MQNVTDLVSLAKPGMDNCLSVRTSERVRKSQVLIVECQALTHARFSGKATRA